jgi:hypothetical protein
MNAIFRRITAATALTAAPLLIAVGVSTSAQAQPPAVDGTSISASIQQFGPMPEKKRNRSAHSNIHHRQNRPIHQNSMTR